MTRVRTSSTAPSTIGQDVLLISLAEEIVTATGPLDAGTVGLLISVLETLAERGLLEVELDVSGLTDLDYPAVVALSQAQQHACATGRVLRIHAADRSVRIALTGCHVDASGSAGVSPRRWADAGERRLGSTSTTST